MNVFRWGLFAGLLVLASWAGIFRYARHGVVASNPTFHEITFRNGLITNCVSTVTVKCHL